MNPDVLQNALSMSITLIKCHSDISPRSVIREVEKVMCELLSPEDFATLTPLIPALVQSIHGESNTDVRTEFQEIVFANIQSMVRRYKETDPVLYEHRVFSRSKLSSLISRKKRRLEEQSLTLLDLDSVLCALEDDNSIRKLSPSECAEIRELVSNVSGLSAGLGNGYGSTSLYVVMY